MSPEALVDRIQTYQIESQDNEFAASESASVNFQIASICPGGEGSRVEGSGVWVSGVSFRKKPIHPRRTSVSPDEPDASSSVSANVPTWLSGALANLDAMLQLEDDWDATGAAPPNAVAVGIGRHVLYELAEIGLRPEAIKPTVEEGVYLEFPGDSKYGAIECYNEGDVWFILSDNVTEPEIAELDTEDEEMLQQQLMRLKKFTLRMK